MKNIIYLVLLLLATSCAKSQQEQVQPTPEPQPVTKTEIESARAIEITPKTRSILGQYNSFAIDFLKAVSQHHNKNLFFSPFSISAALGLLYNGAAGATKEEIIQVLGMDNYTQEEINEYYRELTKALLEVDPHSSLSLANAIWSNSNRGAILKNTFVTLNQNYYDAEVSALDFAHSPALQTINNWCYEKTKGTIPTILDNIDPSTLIILANAIYFKSFWTTDFEKSKTAHEPFYNLDGTKSIVPMMHQKQMFLDYAQMDRCSMVTLPYANTAFTMNLILPNKGVNMDELIGELDGSSWQSMMAHRKNIKVTLSMPRFKVENRFDNIKEVLASMGLSLPFSSNADFSALSDVPAFFSQVIHKSYISVDEDGTESAAITLIPEYLLDPVPNPLEVTLLLDRPFIFAITEKSTGVILFMGKITKL